VFLPFGLVLSYDLVSQEACAVWSEKPGSESVRTLVNFFCLIRPAFLGATERTPGLVVFEGLVKDMLV
jgi:hypothetical protein